MVDRYVVRSSFGSDDLGDVSYVSERGALQHVGSRIQRPNTWLRTSRCGPRFQPFQTAQCVEPAMW